MSQDMQIEMTPLDYGRSFLMGKGHANEARFWIESRTRVIDDRRGICEDFYQTASCKSENTFHEQDLFQRDNYDFLPIFSAGYGLIFRRHAYLSDRYRETRSYTEMFGGYDLHLVEGATIRELPTNAAIIIYSLSMMRLPARPFRASRQRGLLLFWSLNSLKYASHSFSLLRRFNVSRTSRR